MTDPSARLSALDALSGATLSQRTRAGVFVSWTAFAFFAASVCVLRATDGARAFPEGVLSRAIAAHLILVAIPFAFSLAHRGASLDRPRGVLAFLRGFGAEEIERSSARAALRVAAKREAFPAIVLAALSLGLSLAEPRHLARHALASLSLVALGMFAASSLAALGVLASRISPRHGRALLVLVLIVPWLVTQLPVVPSELSLPGAYAELARVVLTHVAP